LVRIVAEQAVSEEQFRGALMDTIRKSFGEIGFARIDPKLVRFDSGKLLAIVACKSSMLTELEAAVGLISSDANVLMVPLVLQVSGTIKGLRKRRLK